MRWGEISSAETMTAGQSVRVNGTNTGFEAYDPAASNLPVIVVGPTGDDGYVTDGTDDHLQIQAAVDVLSTENGGSGGTIQLQDATYDIKRRIVILSTDLTVRGNGQSTKLVLGNSVDEEIFVVGNGFSDDPDVDDPVSGSANFISYVAYGTVVNCHNVHFYDMYLDGNKANQYQGNFADVRYGVSATRNLIRYRSDQQNSYGAVVQNVYAFESIQNGISSESHSFISIIGCIAEDCDNHGIWGENGNNMNIISCYVRRNALAGLKLLAVGVGAVVGCQSKSDDGAGFSFQSCSNISVDVIAYRSGWHAGDGGSNVAADGCYLSQCVDMNVKVSTYGCYGNGLKLNGTDRSTFSGIFRRNGQMTDATYSDILITNESGGSACNDNIFTAITFDNDTSNPTWGNRTKYNIRGNSANVHMNNMISQCSFGSPSTAKVSNMASTSTTAGQADNMIKDNVNFQPTLYYYKGDKSTNTNVFINDGSVQYVRLTGNITITLDTPINRSAELTVVIRQDSTGSRTLGWSTNILWTNGTTPTVNSTADTITIYKFVFIYDYLASTGKWAGYKV